MPLRPIWRPVLERITPYDAGAPIETLSAQRGGAGLVRLSANENPLGPSPAVVAALQREATRAHLYPDGGSTVLRAALAQRLGVAPEQILVGNGADELIMLIAWAVLEAGDEVVVPHPSFEPYTTNVTLTGGTVRPSPLRGYETDLDDIRRRVTARTKAIFLCSPHNPATTIIRRGPLEQLLEALGDDSPLIVLDEAYGDFVDDPEYPDGVTLLRRHPRLLLLRTFSKIAALAGLRVGYAIGAAEAIDRLNRVRAPFNVNRLAQAAALAAVADDEHRTTTRGYVLAERRFMSAELQRRGLRFPASHANFLLVEVPDAATVRARLLHEGLIVRDGAAVGFPGHLRIAIGLRETNERVLAALDGR